MSFSLIPPENRYALEVMANCHASPAKHTLFLVDGQFVAPDACLVFPPPQVGVVRVNDMAAIDAVVLPAEGRVDAAVIDDSIGVEQVVVGMEMQMEGCVVCSQAEPKYIIVRNGSGELRVVSGIGRHTALFVEVLWPWSNIQLNVAEAFYSLEPPIIQTVCYTIVKESMQVS